MKLEGNCATASFTRKSGPSNKLIDAIYAMSYGLNSTINSICSGNETCKPSVCKNNKALVENYNKLRKTDLKE